ncbi:MAG: hypothetical protein JW938_07205 [Candidatus Omnitrophica bacterium]|nr:hypothetical protein [Candidatus Omnitrophota bacterium]
MENTPSRKERRERVREGQRSFEELKSEKRKFTRVCVNGHVDFLTCDIRLLHDCADLENVSQFGVLFRARRAPNVGDILALKFDDVELPDLIDLSDVVREKTGDILGKVVRVDTIDDTSFDIAVNLFKKGF